MSYFKCILYATFIFAMIILIYLLIDWIKYYAPFWAKMLLLTSLFIFGLGTLIWMIS